MAVPKESSKVCLVTGGSRNDTAPIGVLLLNLKENQTWIDHIIIYHDGISVQDQKVMQSILPVEFINYSFPGDHTKFNEIIKYHYTEMVFCKYECFKLLERFQTVLWTDYDVVFQQEVKELIETCPSGIRTLMYRSTDEVGTLRRQLRYGKEQIVGAKYDLDTLSMATGLFVLDRNLPATPKELYEHCIRLTEKYGDCLCLPEQAIFDMLFQDFKITPEAISWDYATHPMADKAISAPIIHAYSHPKFWNGLENEEWNAYYRQWLSMGGSRWEIGFNDWLKNIKKTLAFRLRKLFHCSA